MLKKKQNELLKESRKLLHDCVRVTTKSIKLLMKNIFTSILTCAKTYFSNKFLVGIYLYRT